LLAAAGQRDATPEPEHIYAPAPVVSVDPPHVSSRAAATIRSSSNTVASARSSAAPTVVYEPHLSHGSVDGLASAKTAVRDLIWDPKILDNVAHPQYAGVDVDQNPLYSEFSTADELAQDFGVS
jgi:hypothetical protein